jgi:hypothetical protein
MDANAMEEGEIYDEAREEVVMEDVDHAKLKNKVVKSKETVAGETDLDSHQRRNLRHNLAL